MRVTIQTVDEAGNVTNTPQAFLSDVDVREYLREVRKARRDSIISVGGITIDCNKDDDGIWVGMLVYVQSGVTEVDYTEPNGAAHLLTQQQMLRLIQCRTWYISQCFKTERKIFEQIGVLTTEQIGNLVEIDSLWPMQHLNWIPTEGDIATDNERNEALESLGELV